MEKQKTREPKNRSGLKYYIKEDSSENEAIPIERLIRTGKQNEDLKPYSKSLDLTRKAKWALKEFDKLMEWARKHKLLGAAVLTALDAPIALPAAYESVKNLYHLNFTKTGMAVLFGAESAELLGIEYLFISLDIAAYFWLKNRLKKALETKSRSE